MNNNFDDEPTRVLSPSEMANLLGITVEEYLRQNLERQAHDEFWSDKVWKTHPDDDIYGYVCHPMNQKLEHVKNTENNQ